MPHGARTVRSRPGSSKQGTSGSRTERRPRTRQARREGPRAALPEEGCRATRLARCVALRYYGYRTSTTFAGAAGSVLANTMTVLSSIFAVSPVLNVLDVYVHFTVPATLSSTASGLP